MLSSGEEGQIVARSVKNLDNMAYKYYCWKICVRPIWKKPRREKPRSSLKKLDTLLEFQRRKSINWYIAIINNSTCNESFICLIIHTYIYDCFIGIQLKYSSLSIIFNLNVVIIK